MAPRTVFLDRDGTLNVKAPEGEYVTSWAEFAFLPGALEGVRRLTESSVRVIVVTNQRGIALGRMTESDLAEIHHRMLDELTAAGGRVARVYHCPHDIGTCACRKPEVGMFLAARRDFPDVSFEEAAVIGDSPSDMEAARRIGAAGIYVGDPAELADADDVQCERSLLTAARRLLAHGVA